MLKATAVAQRLGISNKTLLNWYAWYLDPNMKKPENVPALPKYEILDSQGTRGWREEDIPQLLKFKEWVPKGRGGMMGQYNAKYWGDRGKKHLKNK